MNQTLTYKNFRKKTLYGLSFLSLSLFSSIAFAQNAPINFETGGNGAAWTWTAFENGPSGGPVQIVANPSATGINTSTTVAKFTTEINGQPFAGFESQHGADIGTFTLSASNAIVKIMVYKPVISDVGIKFATSTNGSTGELRVANTLINQWEELTFDFSTKIGETNDQIIFFLDFQTRTTQNTCYFDNVTFSAVTAPTMPTVNAPVPTNLAADVISLFSNAYTNVPVDTWRTPWSNGTLTDLQIAGNDVKQYTNLDFVGIETVGPNQINATTMLKFHIDAWTPNLTAFKVKLVDIGADGAFGGGDDKEQELSFTPTLLGWNSYDILLSDFTNLTTRANIAQLILAGNPTGTGNVYIDNVYFHKTPFVNPNVPAVAAPTPTNLAADVISLFSNAYTNVAVDTWRTPWSNGTLTDLQIAGNDVKQYTNLDFVGIETVGPNQINATTMLSFHIDAWTPNLTTFRVKLVDIGADGAFGGGDDKEQELSFTPTLLGWNSYDILLSDFTNLTTRANIAQLILAGNPTGTGNVYIDNVYFHKTPFVNPNVPAVAAPTPTNLAADVISLFSNAYTNVAVDTWRTPWSNGTLTDLQIAGNDVKQYTNLDFVGIETVGPNQINATTMLKFHIDAWTPNLTAFKVKLVDIGADGAFGGGDDKEQELSFTPTLLGWNSYDISLSDFTNLTTRANIAQLILAGNPTGTGNVYIDNVYFHKSPDPNVPSTAAPIPTAAANTVISLFSNTYTNVAVDTWRTPWSNATLTDLQIAGNDTKKYTALDFVGIETVGPNLIDATLMTNFHLDAWTPNMTTFRIKLVDIGADAAFGGGDDKEFEIPFTPVLSGWNTYNILLSDFTGLTTRQHIAQLILSGLPTAAGTVFIDNVYFSRNVVGINSLQNSLVKIYPNPATDQLIIEAKNNVQNVIVLNVLGQEVLTIKPFMQKVNLNISELPTGIYTIKAIVDGQNSTAKFIKN